MVSNQKPTNKAKSEVKNDTNNFEKELSQVISNCRSIIKSNYDIIKNQTNVHEKGSNNIQKIIQENASKLTLEKIAFDMSEILNGLKEHLDDFKEKNDSFSDVEPQLEQMYLRNGQSKTEPKTENKTNTKQQPPAKNKNNVNANNSKNKDKNNAGNKFKSTNKERSNLKNNQPPHKNNYNTKPLPAPTPQNNKGLRNSGNNLKKGSNASAKTVKVKELLRPNNILIKREMYDPLGVLRDEVQRAIKVGNTFTIRGSFQAVRRALLQRGWVEKFHFSYRDRVNHELKKYQNYSISELLDLLRNSEISDLCKKLIKSKLLLSHQVDLYWGFDYESFKECPDKIKLTKINKFRREVFSYTSKQGLCDASKKSFWFQIPGIAKMNHPRSYSLTKNGDTPDFIKDFNITAAMSLLKWVVRNSITQECKIISPSGKVPLTIFDFAVNECYKFIKKAKHEDIDNDITEAFDHEWNNFLENYYKAVHIGNHFKQFNNVTENDLVRKSSYILNRLKEHWPYLEMDGIMNIWILKPTNGSQGVGIHICRTLKYVLNIVKSNPNRRYIIQKYIERPLLIYNTKFDIRQWFLISNSVPLTIWIYKHCYLRFSSQTYNLRKLHESIHLTNNSVQSRYAKNRNSRDIALPVYNMWDSNQFKNYLSDIGYPNAFKDIIYPGMKQCISAAVLMHQDKLDKRKNCFELYGADFMLTEDFKPWLIEINSNPALHASTPITARMCPIVLEDVIKVVVDYERNPKALTGSFELMYLEKPSNSEKKTEELLIQGTPLKTDYFYTPPQQEVANFNINKKSTVAKVSNVQMQATDYLKKLGTGMRQTLENLLEILQKEKSRRLDRKNKSVETLLSEVVTDSRHIQTEGYEIVNLFKSPSSVSLESTISNDITSYTEKSRPKTTLKPIQEHKPNKSKKKPFLGFLKSNKK